ncbi:MAG TPA: phosphoribosyltransferase family protein [Candidatus Bilamarchaeaceae archaeon]|nr:phosphoribosyltransferase family protein [Candidatus Bilamarchaeaceae archaeon]
MIYLSITGGKMTNFNQQEFNKFVIDNSIVGFFKEPIKLKSGRMSNWYVNWRNASEDVYLIDQVSDFVISFTKDKQLKPDCFYGVPEGATKLALLCQYKWAKNSPTYSKGSHVLPMGRGKPKEHGAPKDKYFVGAPKGNVIIVEDVTTTGGSLIKTIDELSELGVKIIAAFGLTNRMEKRDDGKSVEQAVKEKGVRYYNLSSALDLLPIVYKKEKPAEEIGKAIEEEFEKWGVKKLRIR